MICIWQELAWALKAIISLLNPLLKSSNLDVWPAKPDFQDLARALKAIISLLNPLLKSLILDIWPLESDYEDLAKAAKPWPNRFK